MNPTAPCLMQLLVEKAITLHPTREQAASFKAILCTPNICGKDVGPALAWTRSFKEFAHLLPKKNGHVVQQLSVPLLVWGMRQPWADTISASHVINFWFHYQSQDASIGDNVVDLAWGTRAISLVALDPLANRARAEDLCHYWSFMCGQDADLWKWEHVNAARHVQLYDAWLDMARIALPHLRDLEHPTQTLQKTWLTRLGAVFKSMPPKNQSDFLRIVLDSEFSNEVKKAACRKADSLSWLDPAVHAVLRPMFPTADHGCYPELPWSRHKPPLHKGDAARANEAIANLYCPSLSPGFSLMLGPDRASIPSNSGPLAIWSFERTTRRCQTRPLPAFSLQLNCYPACWLD